MPCSICSLDGFYLILNIAPTGYVCTKHICFLCHHRRGFTQTYRQMQGLKGRLTRNYLQVSFESRVLCIWWWLILIMWCWPILHHCTYRIDFQTCIFQCTSAASHTAAGRYRGRKYCLYQNQRSFSEQSKDPACATLKTWAPLSSVYIQLSSHNESWSRGSWQSLHLEQLLGVSFSLRWSENWGLGNQKPDCLNFWPCAN